MKIEQFSRLVNHRISTSGLTFTIPTSNDHSDETWVATDLYIGELGINVTDDTAFIRTNNGIVQLATSGGSGTNTIWGFSSPDIIIGSTYSADSVSPRSGKYTDLGTSSLKWKNLFLGGAADGISTININSGLSIKGTSDGVISTKGAISDNSPISIHTTSNSVVKNQPLFLNTRGGEVLGTGNYNTMISTNGGTFRSNTNATIISGIDVQYSNGLSNVTHIGNGYNKYNFNSNEIVIGGQLAIRGIGNDSSNNYQQSDWITSQALVRTSNATTTTIATLDFGTAMVIQVKAYIIGTKLSDPTKVYSAEIMGVYSMTVGTVLTQVGNPIINEVSSWTGVQPSCELSADPSGLYIQVTGRGTDSINWLCTYSFHKLIQVY